MAYINPQIQINQQENARNDRNMAAIGNGLIGGLSFLEENRRRALDMGRADQAQDFQLAGLGGSAESINKFRTSGDSSALMEDISGVAKLRREAELTNLKNKNSKDTYEANELTKPLEERDDTKKSLLVAAQREKIFAERFGRQEQNKIASEERKLENEKKAGIQKASIPGYEVADPNVIPTTIDAEKIKTASISNKNFEDAGSRILKRLETLDWKDRTGLTNNWSQLQQDVTEMQMQAKNLYELGVLNGPDLSLVNKGLGGLTVIELNRLGPQAAMERVRGTIAGAQQKLQNAVTARGYKPKQEQVKEKAITPDDQAAIQWAQQNKNDPRAAAILQLHGVK